MASAEGGNEAALDKALEICLEALHEAQVGTDLGLDDELCRIAKLVEVDVWLARGNGQSLARARHA